MLDNVRKTKLEIEAANLIREQVVALAGDDEDVIRDSVEGETNLHELLAKLVEDDATDDALAASTAALAEKIGARAVRIKKRIETRRAIMANAMQVAELKTLETAGGTVSQKKVPPKLVVIEEADIPAAFFKPQPPKLDRKALTDALKVEGVSIPGAAMSNGSMSVQIRR